MAGTPRFKVYSSQGEYVAACKHASDAGALVGLYGEGATIRDGHALKHTVWKEGFEDQPAGESYDYVSQVAHIRANARTGATR